MSNAHSSNGPVRTLPGSTKSDGLAEMTCDTHSERPAFKRVQGETDSFGSEFLFMCEECYQKHIQRPPHEAACDWCGTHAVLLPRRDYEEGSSGPIYELCGGCIKKMNDRAAAELEETGCDDAWDDMDAETWFEEFDE